MGQDDSIIVCDFGRGIVKADNYLSETPSFVEANAIGRPIYNSVMLHTEKQRYIGKEAMEHRCILETKSPIGDVINWDDVEAIFDYMWQTLKAESNSTSLLLTQHPQTPTNDYEKYGQICFETFDTKSFNLSVCGVLDLFSQGLTSGLSLNCGDYQTSVLPIFQGVPIIDGIDQINFGGRDTTKYFQKLAKQRDYYFETSAEFYLLDEVKQNIGYIAQNFDSEMELSTQSSAGEKSWELPDGTMVTFGAERFKMGECMFNPKICHKNEQKSIQNLIFDSINNCPSSNKDVFLNNLVISGGNTLWPGFVDRLKSELSSLFPDSEITLNATPDRKLNTWKGGSIFAEKSLNMEGAFISKQDYNEYGPSLFQRFQLS